VVSDTSLESYRDLKEEGVEETQVGIILAFLDRNGPSTAQEIGKGTLLGNHTVTRRRSLLIRSDCVKEAPKRVCSVTRRKAHPLILTPTGWSVLNGASLPEPGPSRRDLELRVLREARRLVVGDSVTEDDLVAAVADLDEYLLGEESK